MQEILRTPILSQAEALQVALEAEGIEAVLSNTQSVGIVGGGVTVHVINDSDVQRALAVKAQLEATRPMGDWRQDLPSRGGMLLLLAGLFLIFLGVVSAREVSGWVSGLAFLLGVGVIGWGWALTRGPGR